MVPALLPARPPAYSAEPPGETLPREVELLDLGAGLDVAEKARVRAVRREVQARYRVAAALEHAAEGGDGGKLRAREVDVRLEYDGDVL